MEKMIKELKQLLSFKDTTDPGDIVLVCIKKPQLLSYALITAITKDSSRRDEWWQVKMQLLTVPPQQVTWLLRTPQLTGQEVFTMGGEEHFIKAVVFQDKLENFPDEESVKKQENNNKPSKPSKLAKIRRIK